MQYWKLGTLEADYFIESVHLARAATPALKNRCSRKLRGYRKEFETMSKRFKLPTKSSYHADYYRSWQIAAIHILSSVPEFQTADSIGKRLGIDATVVKNTLEKLLEMDLVDKDGNRYFAIKGSLHIDRGSSYAFLHLSNWRLKAIEDAQTNENSLHFSSILSLSKIDAAKLKELLLQSIGTCQSTVAESTEETAVALNVDFFEL